MFIALASRATPKLSALSSALSRIVFPPGQLNRDHEMIHCFAASSGINAQPVGFEETLCGAQNRLSELIKESSSSSSSQDCMHVSYYVSIENGIVELSSGCWFDFAWVIVEKRVVVVRMSSESSTNSEKEGNEEDEAPVVVTKRGLSVSAMVPIDSQDVQVLCLYLCVCVSVSVCGGTSYISS